MKHVLEGMEESVRSCYCDLNVVAGASTSSNEELVQTLANYGYECVALNHSVTLARKVQIKAAPDLKKLVENIPIVKRRRAMKVLRRLTVKTDDASLLHVLSSPAVESYDMVAIRPASEKVLQHACSTLNMDVISIDLSERVMFQFRYNQIRQAIERGIYFEICYSPALRDSTARRNTLANALELVKATRGKHIIVSSQAERVFDMRAPADVVNLYPQSGMMMSSIIGGVHAWSVVCHLFGVSGGPSKATITTSCRAVLLHAAMRCSTAKGVVSSRRHSLSAGLDTRDQAPVKEKLEIEGGELEAVSGLKGRKRKRKSQDEDGSRQSKQSKQDTIVTR